MKIENKAPEKHEIVLTTKKHAVYVTCTLDGKTHVQIVDRKKGGHQHLILGEADGSQATTAPQERRARSTRDPRDCDPNHG